MYVYIIYSIVHVFLIILIYNSNRTLKKRVKTISYEKTQLFGVRIFSFLSYFHFEIMFKNNKL